MTEAERITRALKGHWYGHYGVAFCPAHLNTRTPALSIAEAEDGRFLAHCYAGCAFLAILEALRGSGVVEGSGNYTLPSTADLARIRATGEAKAVKREGQALGLWRDALPINGTIAETYLRSRGIVCQLPDVLRFHPECWHGPSAKRLPAMVALVEGCKRVAVHRTYLRSDGTGKAAVEPAKAMLGGVSGGAVRLTDALGPLVVAEGIETALSLASGLLRSPATIWAALSTSGMRRLRLPSVGGLGTLGKLGRHYTSLIIANDGDAPGRDSGRDLAERASGLGWHVGIMDPGDGTDFNDILTAKEASHECS